MEKKVPTLRPIEKFWYVNFTYANRRISKTKDRARIAA